MAPSSPWPVRTVTHGRWPAGDVAPRLCPWWDWSFPGKQIPRSPMSPVAPKSPMAGNWLSQTTPVNSTGSRGCGPWVLASERALPTLVPAEGRLVRGGTEPHSPQQAPVHLCQVRGWEGEALSCWPTCGALPVAHASWSSSAGPDPALPPGLMLSSWERSGAPAEATASAGQGPPLSLLLLPSLKPGVCGHCSGAITRPLPPSSLRALTAELCNRGVGRGREPVRPIAGTEYGQGELRTQ